MYFLRLLGLIGVLLGLVACQPNPLDKALRGALPPAEGDKVVTEYCQSCHIHRDFDPTDHASRMHALYDRQPYTQSTECRTCHLARADTWGARHRKTLWPALVSQKRQK